MRQVRVLIVDDAVVVRRLATTALSNAPGIEVIGTAIDGRDALVKISRLNPDVVLLDVEMPEMDGLETLAEIRTLYPHLIVIMFSAYTVDGAAVTIEALSLGAADYATKPLISRSTEEAVQSIADQLVPKIKALCPGPSSETIIEQQGRVTAAPAIARRINIVAIGTSVGGPAALSELFKRLPPNFPVPILIAQHMPAIFTKQLAENLSGKSQLPVYEAKNGQVLRPATGWIAPGDYHMALMREGTAISICTHRGPPVHSCRPAADVLFRSVAEIYGSGALVVVLTGMGRDGLRGSEEIRRAGGQVLVQDESSSVVWGMPGHVAKAGLANQVLSLDQIPNALIRAVSVNRPALTAGATRPGTPTLRRKTPINRADSDYIRQLVYKHSGIALEKDKDYLIEQRLQPLLNQHGFGHVAELVAELRTNALYQIQRQVVEAMATKETSFFRDFHPFEVLRKSVFPQLIERRMSERELKIWSVGCSSGQEPYSIAMLLSEHFSNLNNWKVELLASDLSEEMVARAIDGRFSRLEINRGLPARLLVKYFEKHADEWTIADEIRQMVQFRTMNLVDYLPSRAGMDIIFMRNLLIYFDARMKKRALEKIRLDLKPDGYLFLGNGETTLNLDDSFERVPVARAEYYRLRPS